MSQKQRQERRTTNEGRRKAIALGVVVAAAVVLVIGTWQKQPSEGPETPSRPASSRTTPPPRAAAPAAEAPTDPGSAPEKYQPLLGEWVRPDGGYVLVVNAVANDGTATVRYLNPRPINVGRAKARDEDGGVGLFVELDDRNYPGSTYTLGYDPLGDQLVGVYFQAVQRASYDVVFVRAR